MDVRTFFADKTDSFAPADPQAFGKGAKKALFWMELDVTGALSQVKLYGRVMETDAWRELGSYDQADVDGTNTFIAEVDLYPEMDCTLTKNAAETITKATARLVTYDG